MKASKFVEIAKDIANNYKTLYVMGCFGAPLNSKNKERYCNNHSYNKKSTRTQMIKNATSDTFGFDCVCLIKGILWGWCGDKNKTYGGATYCSNNVPDVGANQIITSSHCTDISSDFNKIQIGEIVWQDGHVGIYIGNSKVVECTSSWKNNVQITELSQRKWLKHGKLKYIDYAVESVENVQNNVNNITSTKPSESKKATDPAKYFEKSLSGTYKVTASALNIRHGAGITKKIMVTIPKGTNVKCYGYYSKSLGAKWLYIQFVYKNITYTGFAHSKYLSK